MAKQTLISFNEHKLENHFRNVHGLVKNKRPIRDIIWLIGKSQEHRRWRN